MKDPSVGLLALLLLALFVSPAAAHPPGGEAEGDYTRSVISVEVPDVMLTGTDGERVSLRASLDDGKPVMVNFIFTTCPTICPLMSAVFSSARKRLGADREKLRMVSISIDPEHDTPAVLRAYAKKWHADDEWLFLTGEADDIVAVQQAFGAWRGNKMSHRPFTFVRRLPGTPWSRVEGIVRGRDLEREAREMLPK